MPNTSLRDNLVSAGSGTDGEVGKENHVIQVGPCMDFEVCMQGVLGPEFEVH